MEKDGLLINQTLLKTIQDSVKQFAEVIAKTVDADVLIVDNNLNVVGETVLYFRLYSMVDINSIIGQVFLKQEKIVVEDRRQFETCKNCGSYDQCQICGLVGVPIYYLGRVIGAIALVLPRHRILGMFKEIDTTVAFIESMAELLSGKLHNNDEYELSRRLNLERERVLDCLDEGVVCTDVTGEILYYNQTFSGMFGVDQSVMGENLQLVLPHRILREFFQRRTILKNLKISLERGTYQFYGFLSCREVILYNDVRRLVFSFRSVNNIWADASAAGNGSMVTLEWCRGWLLEDSFIDKAKALAATMVPVLIQGPEFSLNEMTAKAVCNYSDRSALGMVNVYCNTIYRELFEQFLFSQFGEIQRANHGTILFHDVENLPIYLQERLLDFMKTGEIVLGNSEVIKSDVRIIFATTKNLKVLAEEGNFVEELYYHFDQNKLVLSSVQSDKTRLAAMLDSGMAYYRKKHGKPLVSLSKDAKLRLLNRSWEGGLNEVDKVLERIVRNKDGVVTDKELTAMGIHRAGSEKVFAISDMEREKIERLLKSGYSKVEIAKMLGIGRATLYRKMAEYQLNGSREE